MGTLEDDCAEVAASVCAEEKRVVFASSSARFDGESSGRSCVKVACHCEGGTHTFAGNKELLER